MIDPVKGMAFVIEDVQDAVTGHAALKDLGFTSSNEMKAGVTGVVYAVNDAPKKCESCGQHAVEPIGLKTGDRIVFSKFVAEQIILNDENGKPIERLKSVPIDAILAILR